MYCLPIRYVPQERMHKDGQSSFMKLFHHFKVGLHISTAAMLIFPVRRTICPFVD